MTKTVEQQKKEDLELITSTGGVCGLSDEQFQARYGQTVAQASAPPKKKDEWNFSRQA